MIDAKVDTLLTVAEYRNFTRAAQELSLTQPAVSHHIAELEKQIGAKLFLRGKGALRLTDAGEIAVKYARRMKAMYEKMAGEIADAGKQLTRLRIGITHTSESNEVVEVLARYSSERPGLNITLLTDTIKNLYDMIANFEIDFAIIGERPLDPAMNALLLDTDYLVCVLANANPLAAHAAVTLDELAQEKLILRLPSSETRTLFESGLRGAHRRIDDFNVIMEVDNIATIKTCVRKNLGVSILPRSACMSELRKGKLTALPIRNLNMIRETNIVYGADFTHFEILQEFLTLYRRVTGGKR